jgi:2-haloacid dehalogenase
MAAPNAVFFDVFGTCVDWRSGVASVVGRAMRARDIALDASAFADAWRAKYQPAMQTIRSGARGYVDLDVLHRENLDMTLAEFGVDDRFSDAERAALNHAWEQLPPWPDTVSGLARIKTEMIIAPCSNGSVALMTRLSRYAGLPWDCILGAGVAGAYKPAPEAYLRSCDALQLDPPDVMMAAAHNDDLAAARAIGMSTCFFPRPLEYGTGQTSDLEATDDWDIIATDLEDAALKITP